MDGNEGKNQSTQELDEWMNERNEEKTKEKPMDKQLNGCVRERERGETKEGSPSDRFRDRDQKIISSLVIRIPGLQEDSPVRTDPERLFGTVRLEFETPELPGSGECEVFLREETLRRLIVFQDEVIIHSSDTVTAAIVAVTAVGVMMTFVGCRPVRHR